ncbi:transcriptional regulator [Nitrosarchaeum sp.]|nr:transcriptional regulator [Nitrosarchaeum sp.]
MSSEDDFSASEIFMELASQTRLEILGMLEQKPCRSTELAKKLNLTIQEMHRNTSRLSKEKIIQKDSEGFFSLTEYGLLVAKQISYFAFLKKFQQFFKDHSTGNIPTKFLQRIGSLKNSELIYKVTNVQEKIKKMEKDSKKYIRLTLAQAWDEEGKILLDKMKNGIKVETIWDDDSVMPDEIDTAVRPKFMKFKKSGNYDSKHYRGKIGLSTIITEDTAAVLLPHEKDEIDFNTMFLSTDKEFHEWCIDLFEYFWSNSVPSKWP